MKDVIIVLFSVFFGLFILFTSKDALPTAVLDALVSSISMILSLEYVSLFVSLIYKKQ